MVRETTREELTIDQYLKGCGCDIITFTAGGYNLLLTRQGSGLSATNGIQGSMKLPNHFKIIRFYDKETDDLIEVQVREPIGEYNYKELFYLMRPTGAFIRSINGGDE